MHILQVGNAFAKRRPRASSSERRRRTRMMAAASWRASTRPCSPCSTLALRCACAPRALAALPVIPKLTQSFCPGTICCALVRALCWTTASSSWIPIVPSCRWAAVPPWHTCPWHCCRARAEYPSSQPTARCLSSILSARSPPPPPARKPSIRHFESSCAHTRTPSHARALLFRSGPRWWMSTTRSHKARRGALRRRPRLQSTPAVVRSITRPRLQPKGALAISHYFTSLYKCPVSGTFSGASLRSASATERLSVCAPAQSEGSCRSRGGTGRVQCARASRTDWGLGFGPRPMGCRAAPVRAGRYGTRRERTARGATHRSAEERQGMQTIGGKTRRTCTRKKTSSRVRVP